MNDSLRNTTSTYQNKDNDYSRLSHSAPLWTTYERPERYKSTGVKCQQVNPKRLPSDHDPEADSVLGRGDQR